MEENVEVVVKVGLPGDEKLMTISTTSRDNISYSAIDYGCIIIYKLKIKNASIISKDHKEWNVNYGKEYYLTRNEDLWAIERPDPIEFFIARTESYENIKK